MYVIMSNKQDIFCQKDQIGNDEKTKQDVECDCDHNPKLKNWDSQLKPLKPKLQVHSPGIRQTPLLAQTNLKSSSTSKI